VGVRLAVSRKQWLWCTDAQKASLERDSTEPDWINLE
jgi:hypothetical protein